MEKEIKKLNEKLKKQLDYYQESQKNLVDDLKSLAFNSETLEFYAKKLKNLEKDIELINIYIDINKNLLKNELKEEEVN